MFFWLKFSFIIKILLANEDITHIENIPKSNKKESSLAVKKYKKAIFDSDITLAEMLEKKPKFPSKKVLFFFKSKKKYFEFQIEKKPKDQKSKIHQKKSENQNELLMNLPQKAFANENNLGKQALFNSEEDNNGKTTSPFFIKTPTSKISKWSSEDTNKFYNVKWPILQIVFIF